MIAAVAETAASQRFRGRVLLPACGWCGGRSDAGAGTGRARPVMVGLAAAESDIATG
jgi:hypothetical protein